MFSKYWQIIRDDSKKTFEVCGQTENTNWFTNTTSGMQKSGMNVSCMTPPVTNKTSSKEYLKIFGYTPEAGLHDRLMKEYRDIMMKSVGEW
jgi:hypothetical protein